MCAWIERHCVLGEGDWFGQPVRLRRWQRQWLYRAYELNPDGSRRWRRVLIGVPKGNGKSPFAAWVAAVELAGPVMFDRWTPKGPVGALRTSPVVPVGAASFEQADLVFAELRNIFDNDTSPLRGFAETFETEILLKGRPGRAYRVAATRGSNDGGRPSCFIADELHEWISPAQEGCHLVLSNGATKRADSLELKITTAGSDLESLLGRLYQLGRKVEVGQAQDDRLLFIWHEAADTYDLQDPGQLRAALRACNPAADDFLDIEERAAKFAEIPEFEFRRYFLNQWTRAAESWLPSGAWARCQSDLDLDPALPVWVGVDMALKHDSVAVVACQPQGERLVVRARVWRPEDDRIDVAAVENHLRQLHRDLDVREVAYDPAYFERSAQALQDEGLPMVEFPQSPQRMVPACQHAYEAITSGRVAHDGDPTLRDHVESAAQREGERGWTLSKGKSKRKIDACIAMVIACYQATGLQESEPTTPFALFSS